MVPKHFESDSDMPNCFRAVLFRMVPKLTMWAGLRSCSFRAVLFRMVPKLTEWLERLLISFRAVLFRMVPKLKPNC